MKGEHGAICTQQKAWNKKKEVLLVKPFQFLLNFQTLYGGTD